MPIDDVLEKISGNDAEDKKPEEQKDKSGGENSEDFDKLLEQLSSEEAKIKAIDWAYTKNVSLKESHWRKLFQFYYGVRKELFNAGRVAEKYDLNRALEVYLEKDNFAGEAGRIYEMQGKFNEAINQYIKAVGLDRHYFFKAGILHKKLGNIQEASNCFERSGEKNGYHEAAKLYEQMKEYNTALRLYLTAQSQEDYKRLLKSKEYKTDCMLKCETDGNYADAYNLAQQLEDRQKMQLYKSLQKILFNQDLE